VERAIERAQAALRNAEALKAEEVAAAEASLSRSFVQLNLKRKKK
jgi:hypothetical protein